MNTPDRRVPFVSGRHHCAAMICRGGGVTTALLSLPADGVFALVLASCYGRRLGQARRTTIVNPIILVIILLILFGGGGFYLGGPYIGGGLGTILLIVLIVLLVRG